MTVWNARPQRSQAAASIRWPSPQRGQRLPRVRRGALEPDTSGRAKWKTGSSVASADWETHVQVRAGSSLLAAAGDSIADGGPDGA